MIGEQKFHLIHVSIIKFNLFIFVDSRGYNPKNNSKPINPLRFNPITNQPLISYKAEQNKIRKEQEIKDLNNQNQKLEQYNNQNEFQQKKGNQKNIIPIEYNPYNHPYSIYQGHP